MIVLPSQISKPQPYRILEGNLNVPQLNLYRRLILKCVLFHLKVPSGEDSFVRFRQVVNPLQFHLAQPGA